MMGEKKKVIMRMKIKISARTKILVFVLFLISLNALIGISNVNSANCGGGVSCNCGDTVISSYNLTSDLKCVGSGLSFSNRVVFDCKGFEISGSGSGNGLNIIDLYSLEIKNCVISNFSNGIYFNKKSSNNDFRLYSNNNFVFNNVLKNNEIGIYLGLINLNNNIFENVFKNNSHSGIFVNNYGNIWNNNFYDSGIRYSQTVSANFCKDNTSNNYFDGAIGPECNCLVPYDNMRIVKSVDFCKGKYFLNNGVYVESNNQEFTGRYINCNGAEFVGNGINSAITLKGGIGGKILNCVISNYTNGIVLTSLRRADVYDFKTYFARNYIVFNNTFFNVNNGIYMSSNCLANNISNNNFYVFNYSLFFNLNSYNSNDFINARNNYFGTNNLTQILLGIKNISGNFSVEPFITQNRIPDLIFGDYEISESLNSNSNLGFKNINLEIINNGDFIYGDFNLKIVEIKDDKIIGEKFVPFKKYIYKNSKIDFSFEYDFTGIDEIKIYFLYDGNISSFNYLNLFNLDREETIYYDVNLKSEVLNFKIEEYLSNHLMYVKVEDELKADYIIVINDYFKDDFFYINLYNKKPYEAEIYSLQNKIIINSYSEEGYLYAVMKFLEDSTIFFDTENKLIIKKEDISAITVFDFIDYKKSYYNLKYLNNDLINLVFDKKRYSVVKKEIYFNSTQKYNLEIFVPVNSPKYKKYFNFTPMVMGGGLFSDIKSFEELGKEFANEGRDVYLIELTGGNNLECDLCYNYDYDFLVEKVFPFYINYILLDSKRNQINYVGHSNGGRTGLDSVLRGYVNSDKIRVLVLMGIPGSFSDSTFFGEIIGESGDLAIQKLEAENRTHVNIYDIGYGLDKNSARFFSNLAYMFRVDTKISLNLFKDYYNWINDSSDEFPKTEYHNVKLGDVVIISGNFFNLNSDMIVPISDQVEIFNSLNSDNKIIKFYDEPHIGMAESKNIKNYVKTLIYKNG